MARMTDDELRTLYKEGISHLYRMDRENPTAWADELQKVEQMQIENPQLADRNAMIHWLTPFFIEKLRTYAKPMRYAAEDYETLITKFVLLFDRPFHAAVAACDLLDACPDPTEKIEDCIRFEEVNHGAKFERLTEEQDFERRVKRATEIAAAQGRPITDAARAERQFKRLFDMAKSIRQMGLTREELIEKVSTEFLQQLDARGLKTREEDWYRSAIQFIMRLTEDPEQTAVGLYMLSTAPDPTNELEKSRAYAARSMNA